MKKNSLKDLGNKMKLKNLISKLLAVNLFIQPFIPANLFSDEKPPSFLENIVNYKKEVIYLKENMPCTLYINVETNNIDKIAVPIPIDKNEEKALKFAYYIKKDFLEVLKALEDAIQDLNNIKKDLINYSFNFLTYVENQNSLIVDSIFGYSPLKQYANLPSSLEERLWQDVVRKGKEFWESLKGDNPSLERIIMNYLGLKGSLKELERYERLEEIKRKQYVKDLWDRRYATLDYEMRNTLEILSKEISKLWQKEKEIIKIFWFDVNYKDSFFSSKHDERLTAVFDKYLQGRVGAYPGWTTPTALWLIQVNSVFWYVHAFLEENNISIDKFSVRDAWEIYKNRKNFLDLLDILSIPPLKETPLETILQMKNYDVLWFKGSKVIFDNNLFHNWTKDESYKKILTNPKKAWKNKKIRLLSLPFAYSMEGFKIKKPSSHSEYFKWIFELYFYDFMQARKGWLENKYEYMKNINILNKSQGKIERFIK